MIYFLVRRAGNEGGTLENVITRFLQGFNENGGNFHDEDTPYYEAIDCVVEEIRILPNVEEVRALNYEFLVTSNNQIGLFPRVVRRIRRFITNTSI